MVGMVELPFVAVDVVLSDSLAWVEIAVVLVEASEDAWVRHHYLH